MKWYFYLNYYIYRFYCRYKHKGELPVFRAFLTTMILIGLNLSTITTIYELLSDFWTIPKDDNYKMKAILELSALAFFNYVILYRKKKYIEVFDEFRRNNERYKKWDKSVMWYIILTVAIMLVVLIIADLRNHNFELYFLK